jgi:hypothetical protein
MLAKEHSSDALARKQASKQVCNDVYLDMAGTDLCTLRNFYNICIPPKGRCSTSLQYFAFIIFISDYKAKDCSNREYHKTNIYPVQWITQLQN